MQFRVGGSRITVDMPHFVFVTAIVGWCAWYLQDARANSRDAIDLLLIEPLTIAVFIVYLFIVKGICKFERAETPAVEIAAEEQRAPLTKQAAFRIFGSMVLLTLYVVVISHIGFDVGTFFYVMLTLLMLGERRWTFLVLVPLGFTALTVFSFSYLLQMPMPLAIGWGQP